MTPAKDKDGNCVPFTKSVSKDKYSCLFSPNKILIRFGQHDENGLLEGIGRKIIMISPADWTMYEG